MKYRLFSSGIATLAVMSTAMIPSSYAQVNNAAFTPATTAKQTQFRVDYDGALYFLPIGEMTVSGQINDYGYGMRADIKTKGITALKDDKGMWLTSTGYLTETSPRPTQHISQKLNRKSRRIELNYDAAGNTTSSIVPRFGSMGEPPASDAERREATDTISAILRLMMTGKRYGTKVCDALIPVFDGRRRYNLRVEPAGTKSVRSSAYSGETTLCHVYMETVSGYDADDLLTAEEASTPLEVYMVNYEDADLWIPIRFQYRISGVKVNIKARNIDVSTNL